MRRTWGIALAVAACGHAAAVVGIGRFEFSMCGGERRDAALGECVVVLEEAPEPERVEEAPRVAEVATGVSRLEAREVLGTDGTRRVVEGVQGAWDGAARMGGGFEGAMEGVRERGAVVRAWVESVVEVRESVRAAAMKAREAGERQSHISNLRLQNAHAAAESAAAPLEGGIGSEKGPSAGAVTGGASGASAMGAGSEAGAGGVGTDSPDAGGIGPGVGPALAGGNRAPAYPADALRRRVEGVVVVRADVDVIGGVSAAAVVQSAGDAVLDASALAAVKGWRFEPGRDGLGRAVASRADVPVEFRIRKER